MEPQNSKKSDSNPHKNNNFRGGQADTAHNPPQPGMQACFSHEKTRSPPSYQPQQDAVKSGMSRVHAALLTASALNFLLLGWRILHAPLALNTDIRP